MRRALLLPLLATVFLSGCGGHEPNPKLIHDRLVGAGNVLATSMTEERLAKLGGIICKDPEHPSTNIVAVAIADGAPSATTTEVMQVASLLEDEYCPQS